MIPSRPSVRPARLLLLGLLGAPLLACSNGTSSGPVGATGGASAATGGSSGSAGGSGGVGGGSSGGAGGTAGKSGGTGGAPGAGGNGSGGGPGAGGSGSGGTPAAGGAGGRGAGDGGAAVTGACGVTITKSTANVTAPATPVAGACTVEQFDDGMGHSQINHHVTDTEGGAQRDFGIDQFGPRTPGTSFDIATGYDFQASRGVYVSYLELGGLESRLWNADRGTITLKSVSGKTYTVEVKAAHMVPAPNPMGDNKATGDFEVSGTLTATLP